MEHERKRDTVTARVTGELDHYSAQTIRRELDALIAEPGVKRLVLDLRDMTFMDSSGIGVILGRYRTMRERGGSVAVKNMNPQVERVFTLSGMRQVIQTL
ncbi:MAG: anti-sigma factor antagonist [Clostridia bacterium]|nr:anti-sigma factor antagonist [Clostridia bacterium]MBR0407608.1 anti-sigma factor antagonist [Clostridia bacterium]